MASRDGRSNRAEKTPQLERTNGVSAFVGCATVQETDGVCELRASGDHHVPWIDPNREEELRLVLCNIRHGERSRSDCDGGQLPMTQYSKCSEGDAVRTYSNAVTAACGFTDTSEMGSKGHGLISVPHNSHRLMTNTVRRRTRQPHCHKSESSTGACCR